LLGEYRTERRVQGATILGGETMVAYRASYARLGSGARPLDAAEPGQLVDELDVADLESEAAHSYALFTATSAQNVAIEWNDAVDGARRGRSRERFELEVVPNGTLVARLSAETPVTLAVTLAGVELAPLELEPDPVSELSVALPSTLAAGRAQIMLVAHGGTFSALHYWSYR
jgi:hypothetical protein